jgi:hypothetical protein
MIITMDNKKIRTLEEIKKEIEEPKYDFVEKFSKISDDKKSLLIRIPQDVRNHFKIEAGDKIRFYAEFKEDEIPELKISLVKKDA